MPATDEHEEGIGGKEDRGSDRGSDRRKNVSGNENYLFISFCKKFFSFSLFL